jgi:hypothetical protein
MMGLAVPLVARAILPDKSFSALFAVWSGCALLLHHAVLLLPWCEALALCT